ncbi:NERD domain-containing protein [Bacillus sp. sid0103]|uniref:nuclease-related domain-containing protein n=1 Tax=Bacillus sp. sid0103 TaxID=2856337 RepID=UPI001C447183|nr:nuclease-related domain-containing protein [Bacillus sp. sid0103]MBV7509718.1 NERD domain-containing protein [Bacillus sp. sid0103]
MQPYKPRLKSKELRILSALNARMELSSKDKQHYAYLEKGYKGEVVFDQLTSKLENDLYVLNDLCLEHNKSFFQIDTLVIAQHTIYPFEIKNYEGDYRYKLGNFYPKLSKDEIKNPLDQLKWIKALLRPLLKNLGFYLSIEGDVTFVNPSFTLYQAPLNEPIIHPTQLNALMKKLNEIPSKLTHRHKMLADQLISMHQTESPYTRYPPYNYNSLQKGVTCAICHSFVLCVEEKKLFVCDRCGHEETVDSAVLRCVEELVLLFPDIKITTNVVHEWCGVIESKKLIRRVLVQNYTLIGFGQWSYYE